MKVDRRGEQPPPEHADCHCRPHLFVRSQACIWRYGSGRATHDAAPVEGRLASVSYNRFARRPSAGLTVPEAQIRADLTAIAGQAKAVRTYASTQGLERVPADRG